MVAMDINDRWAARQAILPMHFEDTSLKGDGGFIVSLCNQSAYEAICKQKLWPDNRLLILGEAGSGKSHLAKIWIDRVGAQVFKAPFEKLYQDTCSAIIAEDVDSLAEKELFHLINYCVQERITLLMTARTMPAPKLQDLKSRLNATHKILIKAPDDELVKILLHKYFVANQINVDPEVFDYLSTRIERSFAAIRHFSEQLNTASLEQKRAITVPFVRSILG